MILNIYYIMKKFFILFLSLVTFNVWAQNPKYIFYFIGDGMGVNHLSLTRGAVSAKDGKIGFSELSFTDFPVLGLAKTHALTRLTTCSAAAGTALASGNKTSIGTIGMNATHDANFNSVAVAAKKNGKKVGIITSVSIDHATPAAFYAHQPKRSQYKEIANWIPKADFDLYAGSGLLEISPTYLDSVKSNFGYTIFRGANVTLSGNKAIWIEEEGKNADNFALAIDRKDGDMALPAVVKESIKFLDNKDGFFMMVEGGQIDWAAHANDAAGIIYEVLDFSEAVAEAIEFYKKHPTETLIVITADHETGGLSLGRKDRGYDTNLELLFTQGGSRGVVGDEKANQINKDAGIRFPTDAHTAAFVPVYAIGVGSENFRGELDNTDIPNAIFNLLK